MTRGSGKAPGKPSRRPATGKRAPRRRSTPRSRSPLGWALLLAGVVSLSVLAVYGYRFLANPEATPAKQPEQAAPAGKRPAEPDRGPETPPLEQALLSAGYEHDRIGATDGVLFVETFDPPEVVAHKIQVADESLRVSTEGEEVRVTFRGGAERLRVIALKRDTEGETFTEVEEPAPPIAERPKQADAPSGAVTASASGGRRIVLILDDVGFENQPLEEAAGIDAALTFAVIPTAPRAGRAATMLAERGFEVICHLPMEPLDYPRQSPGSQAILVSLTDEEIRSRTREGLRAIPEVTGMNNHMGSRATRDRRVMENVAAVLREEGLFFIDSRTAGNSIAASVVGDGAVPVASRDVFLDDDPDERSIRRQLAELARVADRKEFAVGIGHVYPSTVRVLLEEIPRLKAKGYTFHFAREAVRRVDDPPAKIAGAPTAGNLAQSP